MGYCAPILKVSNGVWAIILGILGVSLALLGTFVILDNADDLFLETKSSNNINFPPIAVLVLGIVLFLIVFLGCLGICRESPMFIETYGGVLVLLALIHFGIGGWTVNHYQSPVTHFKLLNDFRGEIWQIYQRRDVNPEPLNNLQNWFECCGYDGWADYRGEKLPKSCCPNEDKLCNPDDAFNDGCSESVTDTITGMNYILGLTSIAIGVAELIGAILAFSVSCTVWRKQSLSW